MFKKVVVFVLGCILILSEAFNKAMGYSLTDLNFSRHRRQTEDDIKCILPPYPENGEWKVVNDEANPGGVILTGSVIKFSCNSKYKLSSDSPYLVCDDNWKSWTIPECEELCPPLYPSDTYELRCFDKRGTKIKCNEATHGTYLEYDCARFYETPFNYKKTLLCEDGKWNYLKPVCQPVCGKKIGDNTQLLIYGSKPNEKIEYPWVAVIYQRINDSFINICGGSILSQTVVVTAAHCVTNNYGDILPKENYLIGAGKLYGKYQAPNDKHAQYIKLFKIIVHNDYRASSRNYLADIALLITNGEFVLTEVVQPVCFSGIDKIDLRAGKIGEVSGWGQTEDGLPSEVLRTLTFPYKYETTCAAELPSDWADKYNMIDKICAGFYNQSTSVCDGDSGSGLAFKNVENNRYYIHGIVSLGHQIENQCNIQQNSLYTKVAFHYDFVDQILSKYAPVVKDCILPKEPKNGKWTIDQQTKKPGDVVPSSVILHVECNEGFKPSSSKVKIECGSAHDMPTCEKLCPSLKFPPYTNYQCTDAKGININCSEAIHGVELTYSCPRNYKIPSGTDNIRTCVKGSWGSPAPKCIGRTVNDCGRSIKDNKTGEGLEYPWNVNLYKREKDEYIYYCGGSIISRKVVLTAAYCVTEKEQHEVLPTGNFVIAAGKNHRKYNDSRDVGAQYLEVTLTIPHPSYHTSQAIYTVVGSIALILVKTEFIFNSYVQPICFNYVNEIPFKFGDRGLISIFKFPGSEELEAFQLSFGYIFMCYATRFYDNRLTDKICAVPVFHNYTITWCNGNEGRAFVVKNSDNNRYYVQGIFDPTAIIVPSCGTFTSVSYYYDFIEVFSTHYV